MSVEVKIIQEEVLLGEPARVLICDDVHTVEVIAEIKLQKGADGKFYHAVTLKMEQK